MASSALPFAPPARREAAVEVLVSPALDPVVDFVAWRSGEGRYEVASFEGHARFSRVTDGTTPAGATRWRYDVAVLAGRNPIERQDPAHLAGLAAERAVPHPRRSENSYPHGYDHLAQLFDHPDAPDLVVCHTAAHYWGEHGGHLGEHGSLDVTQARAPFVASGAGVVRSGMQPRSCRLVDVAPVVLELLAGETAPWWQWLGAGDGELPDGVVSTPGGARHVVAFLLDGTNANVLYDLAARGGAPNIARLMAEGTTFAHGAIASLPTVTLANHTGILTGRHPGHHGVLHNAWIDRATGEQVVTNSPTTWISAMDRLAPGVETLHHAVQRARPGAWSVSVNEPCDSGAHHSVFEQLRRGEAIHRPPRAEELPDATERFVRPVKDYQWSSMIDHTAVTQFLELWSGRHHSRGATLPTFTWVNFTLTDAAFHEGGPYSAIAAASVADTDARLGRMLEAVDAAGALGETAFLLVADHGMELADTSVTGDWDEALRAGGVTVRDEGYGFCYLPGDAS